MSSKHHIVSAWDESVISPTGTPPSNIKAGPILTFKIPAHLPFRRVYLFVQPKLNATFGSDFFLSGDVILTNDGSIQTVLPANIARNTYNSVLQRSIVTLFENTPCPDTDPGKCGALEKGVISVTLGNRFEATPGPTGTNIVLLSPVPVQCDADRFTYTISEWSRDYNPGTGTGYNAVIGASCFGMVISSNYPL